MERQDYPVTFEDMVETFEDQRDVQLARAMDYLKDAAKAMADVETTQAAEHVYKAAASVTWVAAMQYAIKNLRSAAEENEAAALDWRRELEAAIMKDALADAPERRRRRRGRHIRERR